MRQFRRAAPLGGAQQTTVLLRGISGPLSEAGINNRCENTVESMGFVDVLRGVIGTSTAVTATLYECRHCGTTLSADTETCPTCGGEDVACYQI